MVSQLDQGISIALANTREWRNSFAPVNCFPQEVLSLIPTHLPRESDLIHASSVCRHWRRTFIQYAELWSKLDLGVKRCSLFVKTQLERAKGSPLDIISAGLGSPDILALISPRTQQLKKLNFLNDHWFHIQLFSEASHGPLPLLRYLQVHIVGHDPLDPDSAIRPSLPLFSGAVNLEEFCLCVGGVPYLNRFTFPNLTAFKLTAIPGQNTFPASQLLDFLDVTPTLRTIHVAIDAEISLEGVLPRRIVALPNVERFAVAEKEPGYRIATCISCPSAKHVSLMQEDIRGFTTISDVFPTSDTWNAIPPQYMADQIDEVVLESTISQGLLCSISFLSPSSATLRVGYKMVETYRRSTMIGLPPEWEYVEGLRQASRAIQSHPLFANFKRLRIQDWRSPVISDQLKRATRFIGPFFKSMSPLEELTLDASDLRPYLFPFTDLPDCNDVKRSYVYPQIKGLTIFDREQPLETGSEVAIVEFARSQHARGVPFERVVFRSEGPAAVPIAERLQPWVGSVHFYQEVIVEGAGQDSMKR